MQTAAAVVATVVLGALAALQVAAACGAPVGRLVWGGRHRVLPTRLRVGSAVSVLLYAAMAWVLLDQRGVLAWVLTGYFALGVVVNAASRSPAERITMTPTCLLLAACSAVVAAS